MRTNKYTEQGVAELIGKDFIYTRVRLRCLLAGLRCTAQNIGKANRASQKVCKPIGTMQQKNKAREQFLTSLQA